MSLRGSNLGAHSYSQWVSFKCTSTTERSDEMKSMMQDAFDLVILLLDTGARYSEIANIEWQRIDLAERSIHLWRSKVQNETVLYMMKRCCT